MKATDRPLCSHIALAAALAVAAVIAQAACSGDRDKTRATPEDSTRGSSQGPTRELAGKSDPPAPAPARIPAEYRVLVAPDLAPEEFEPIVARAAKAAGSAFAPNSTSKCRLVQLLDVAGQSGWLRQHGFTLRLRQRLEGSCQATDKAIPKGREAAFAVSFNRRIDDLARASTQRDRFAPDRRLAADRTKQRFKHITAISSRSRASYYRVGSTVRKLKRTPADLAALRDLFPGVAGLDGFDPRARLVPVGGLQLHERNYDLGTVTAGGHRLELELAVWRAWQKGKPAAPVVAELLVSLAENPVAKEFAAALERELRGHIHWAESREALVYHLAAGTKPPRKPH